MNSKVFSLADLNDSRRYRERERIECKCIAITEKIYTQYLQGHLRSPAPELPMVSDNPYDKTIRDIE